MKLRILIDFDIASYIFDKIFISLERFPYTLNFNVIRHLR